MNIQEILGEAYVEGMTLEEMNAALADKKLVDPTTLPKSVNKDVFDKTASELSKYKKELEEIKTKSMTEEEKTKAVLEETETIKNTYLKQLAVVSAKEVFATAGIPETDYASLLESIVTPDAEKTKELANNMVKMIATQKAKTEKELEQQFMNGTRKPPAGSGSQQVDKAAFMKMGYKERAELFQKDPVLFETLNK